MKEARGSASLVVGTAELKGWRCEMAHLEPGYTVTQEQGRFRGKGVDAA